MSPDAEALIMHRFWQLYPQEKLGKTPQVTEELDRLQEVIRCEKLGQQLKLPYNPSSETPNSRIATDATI